MKKTALEEEEILEDVNRLKKEWGIEEPIRLSGGFYQNYCNLSVSNRKIERKETDLGGCTGTGTGTFAGDRKGMVAGIQPDGSVAPEEVYQATQPVMGL